MSSQEWEFKIIDWSVEKNEKTIIFYIKGDDRDFVANFYHRNESLRAFLTEKNFDTSNFLSKGFQNIWYFILRSTILKSY